MECKNEREMLQVELYSSDVEQSASVLCAMFGMDVIEAKPGWRHLRHRALFDLMLFDPLVSRDGESHWPDAEPGTYGSGTEIVICTDEVSRRREIALTLGLRCTELRYPPWGSIEFMFRLLDGHLIRVKQPPDL